MLLFPILLKLKLSLKCLHYCLRKHSHYQQESRLSWFQNPYCFIILLFVCVCMHVERGVCVYIGKCVLYVVYMYMCIGICMYGVHMYTNIYMYICVYVCV